MCWIQSIHWFWHVLNQLEWRFLGFLIFLKCKSKRKGKSEIELIWNDFNSNKLWNTFLEGSDCAWNISKGCKSIRNFVFCLQIEHLQFVYCYLPVAIRFAEHQFFPFKTMWGFQQLNMSGSFLINWWCLFINFSSIIRLT